MVISIPTHTLNDGTTLPALGLGTWPLGDDEAQQAVLSALEAGYRLIDTATNYRNETGVGRGVASGVVPREEVVVTTKLPAGTTATRRPSRPSSSRGPAWAWSTSTCT